jgi:hypothetical protein
MLHVLIMMGPTRLPFCGTDRTQRLARQGETDHCRCEPKAARRSGGKLELGLGYNTSPCRDGKNSILISGNVGIRVWIIFP